MKQATEADSDMVENWDYQTRIFKTMINVPSVLQDK